MLTQTQEKYREILQVAENLFRQDPDWVTFFREVVGIDGTVRKCFPSFEELTSFEQSEEFDAIQKMLVKLREKRTSSNPETEPTRVITVRLPKSMHEYLRTEAHDLRTSMNKLCISKLLQVIGEEMIPNERSSTPAPKPALKPIAASTPLGHMQQPLHQQPVQPLAQQPLQAQPIQAQPLQAQPLSQQPLHQPQVQPRTQQQIPSPFKPSQPRF